MFNQLLVSARFSLSDSGVLQPVLCELELQEVPLQTAGARGEARGEERSHCSLPGRAARHAASRITTAGRGNRECISQCDERDRRPFVPPNTHRNFKRSDGNRTSGVAESRQNGLLRCALSDSAAEVDTSPTGNWQLFLKIRCQRLCSKRLIKKNFEGRYMEGLWGFEGLWRAVKWNPSQYPQTNRGCGWIVETTIHDAGAKGGPEQSSDEIMQHTHSDFASSSNSHV